MWNFENLMWISRSRPDTRISTTPSLGIRGGWCADPGVGTGGDSASKVYKLWIDNYETFAIRAQVKSMRCGAAERWMNEYPMVCLESFICCRVLLQV